MLPETSQDCGTSWERILNRWCRTWPKESLILVQRREFCSLMQPTKRLMSLPFLSKLMSAWFGPAKTTFVGLWAKRWSHRNHSNTFRTVGIWEDGGILLRNQQHLKRGEGYRPGNWCPSPSRRWRMFTSRCNEQGETGSGLDDRNQDRVGRRVFQIL